MKPETKSETAPLAVIGVDIGKEVFGCDFCHRLAREGFDGQKSLCAVARWLPQ